MDLTCRNFACLLVGVALCGCRDDPVDVLAQARTALATKDEATFLELLEPRAASLLRAAPATVSKSGQRFKVLRSGKVSAELIPKGEVVDTIESGKRAVVVVKSTTGKFDVPLRLVEGKWRLDLLEMDTFYTAVHPTKQ